MKRRIVMMKRKSSALLALVMTVMMSVSVFSGCKKKEIENTPVDNTTPVVSVGDTWDCPSCGQADVSSKFCPNCGEAKDWTCPSCGQTEITSKFCPNCGTGKDSENAPQTETTAATEAPEATTVATTAPTTAATTAPTTAATTKATTAATTVATTAATTAATTPSAPSAYVKNANRYVFGTLTDDEKQAYIEIFNGLKNRAPKILLTVDIGREKVNNILQTIYFQEPYISTSCVSYEVSADGKSILDIEYKFTESEVAAMEKACDNAMAKIQAKFPANASDYDKVKAIHDYIVTNTVFSKNNKYSGFAYGPLVEGVGQCEGYAKAMTYALTHFGIENVRMTGTKYDGLSHAWNKVKVSGKWYNIDATWDEYYSETQSRAIRYTFFLIPDTGIMSGSGRNYIPQCTFTPPSATSWDSNYFVKSGYYATSLADAKTKMQKAAINAAKNKQEVIQIKCSDKAVYDQTVAWLTSNYTSVINTVNSTSGCYKCTAKSLGDTTFLTTDKYIVELVVTYQ